jgi:hypothetical protein
MKITYKGDYAKLRKRAMPEIGDQLDDLWKLIETIATKDPAVAKALKDSPVFARIKEVKQKIPKPLGGA